MNLVIVESPAKAKTINKYLGRDYEVVASFGHVRDLPAKDGSVDPKNDFAMLWEMDPKASKRMSEIARSAKDADRLILATDPDREGEAISWHVLSILRDKKAIKGQKVERVVFNAITQQAVRDAMASPREIDQALVDAYLARRALDYLVGFTISPVLWRKLPGARSAGRVQSVALRLVCDRELEIEKFKTQEYWSVIARLKTLRDDPFEARLTAADGRKLTKFDIANEEVAESYRRALGQSAFKVRSVEAKPVRRHPDAPFTTSTLQQEASRKLGLAPARTMQIAQRLYEGIDVGGETVGLITYMRTDGVQMAQEAISACRSLINSKYGARYLPSSPRLYKNKAKNAQEAHEAIRPTDPARTPKDVAGFLDEDQRRLYELIWKRTLASQMQSADLERTTALIDAAGGGRQLELSASGQVVVFDGFLTLYQESRDDDAEDEDGRRLPPMTAGEGLSCQSVEAKQHFTEPPPRYSEASLVKKMEELGIGRPSTYASVLAVIRDRGYVRLDKKRLVPEDKGRLVTAFLESFFARYVEYDFTARLEEQLDEISAGGADWRAVLHEFWNGFIAQVDSTKELKISEVIDALDALLSPHLFPEADDGRDVRACPTCADGRLSLKLSKFGAFIGCSHYPDCRYTRQLSTSDEGAGSLLVGGSKSLGTDPETGLDITLREGRFGPYVQLGEGEKPKRSSLPKGVDPLTVDLDMALGLLSLPRTVGLHPETGEPILASIGRFGPYVQHGKTYATLEAGDEVLTVGLNRAVTLIAEKQAKGFRGRGAGGDPGRVLGDHPAGGSIAVKAGRYGPYVTHDGVNATLPRSASPDSFTLEEAIALLAEKREKDGGLTKRGGKTTRKATPKAKSTAKSKRKAEPKATMSSETSPAKKASPKKSVRRSKSV